MNISNEIIEEVLATLRQANVVLLGLTALDSSEEFARKRKENERAINRRIKKAIMLLENSKGGIYGN